MLLEWPRGGRIEVSDSAATSNRSICGDEVQLALVNSLVLRHHAVIERIGQDWTLTDSSRNGTFIEGVRITQVKVTSPTRVLLGDKADGAEVELIPELLAAMRGPFYALAFPD